MKKSLSFLIVLLLLLASPALAIERGGYINLSLTAVNDWAPGQRDSVPSVFPLRSIGYKFSDIFYIQGTYQNQGSYLLEENAPPPDQLDTKVAITGADVQALFAVPIWKISLVGSVGVNFWDMDKYTSNYVWRDTSSFVDDDNDPITPDIWVVSSTYDNTRTADLSSTGVDPIFGGGIIFDAAGGAEVQLLYTTTDVDGYTVDNYRFNLSLPF